MFKKNVFVLFAFFVLVTANTAFAADAASISIETAQQGKTEYQVKPSEPIQVQVRVTNPNANTVNFEITQSKVGGGNTIVYPGTTTQPILDVMVPSMPIQSSDLGRGVYKYTARITSISPGQDTVSSNNIDEVTIQLIEKSASPVPELHPALIILMLTLALFMLKKK